MKICQQFSPIFPSTIHILYAVLNNIHTIANNVPYHNAFFSTLVEELHPKIQQSASLEKQLCFSSCSCELGSFSLKSK